MLTRTIGHHKTVRHQISQAKTGSLGRLRLTCKVELKAALHQAVEKLDLQKADLPWKSQTIRCICRKDATCLGNQIDEGLGGLSLFGSCLYFRALLLGEGYPNFPYHKPQPLLVRLNDSCVVVFLFWLWHFLDSLHQSEAGLMTGVDPLAVLWGSLKIT